MDPFKCQSSKESLEKKSIFFMTLKKSENSPADPSVPAPAEQNEHSEAAKERRRRFGDNREVRLVVVTSVDIANRACGIHSIRSDFGSYKKKGTKNPDRRESQPGN
jgi:hypothetical protein